MALALLPLLPRLRRPNLLIPRDSAIHACLVYDGAQPNHVCYIHRFCIDMQQFDVTAEDGTSKGVDTLVFMDNGCVHNSCGYLLL